MKSSNLGKTIILIPIFLALIFFALNIQAAQPDGKWIRSDMHTHPNNHRYGDNDHGTSPAMADNYKELGFNHMWITDHGHFKEFLFGHAQAYNDSSDATQFHLSPGQETAPGYIHYTIGNIDINLSIYNNWPTTDYKKSVQGQMDYIRWFDSVGGWISANHLGPPNEEPYLTNYPDASSGYRWISNYDSLRQMVEAGLDGFEAFNGGNAFTWNQSRFIWEAGGWWDSILVSGLRFTAQMGSDKHDVGTIYHGYGANNVYILQDTITDEAYWEAMFAGRLYVGADFHSGSPFAIIMNMTVGDSMMGARVQLEGNVAQVRVQANLDTVYIPIWNDNIPQLDTIRVISGGQVVATILPGSKVFDSNFEITVSDSGYVRAEIIAVNLSHTGSPVRALGNPIYLIEGTGSTIIDKNDDSEPESFNSYPNPFNPTITISFPASITRGKLSIYNVRGEQVFSKNIKNNYKWNAKGLSAGFYTVIAKSADKTFRKKIMLAK